MPRSPTRTKAKTCKSGLKTGPKKRKPKPSRRTVLQLQPKRLEIFANEIHIHQPEPHYQRFDWSLLTNINNEIEMV